MKIDGTFATHKNTEIGDKVCIPINGEMYHEEQICVEYEIIKCFRATIKPSEQIVGTEQEPLPEFIPFDEEMAYKIK